MSFNAYIQNIPFATNAPAVDQPNMLINTNSIANIIAQDHFGFNDNAGGNHKWVHLKNHAAPGGLGGNADSVLYANTDTTNSWPFWQNAIGSIQMLGAKSLILANLTLLGTNTAYANPGSPTALLPKITGGFTTLPGGLVYQYGIATPIGNTGAATFAIAFPSGNPPFAMSLLVERATTSAAVTYFITSTSSTGFTYTSNNSTSGIGIHFFAIGN